MTYHSRQQKYRRTKIRSQMLWLVGAGLTIVGIWLLSTVLKGGLGPTSESIAEPLELQQLQTNSVRAKYAENQNALDVQGTNWTSEAFSETAEAQIKQVLKNATAGSKMSETLQLLDANFACTPLRPTELPEHFQDFPVNIWRAPDSVLMAAKRTVNSSGFPNALKAWLGPLVDCQDIRTEVKTISVKLDVDANETVHVIHVSGLKEAGIAELHADWRCKWQKPSLGESPRLLSIEQEAFQLSSSDSKQPFFQDVTLAVFDDEPAYREQLSHGLDHWLARIETIHGMYLFAEYGIAVGDVNGDGLEDVYVCQPGGLPNRLLVQNPDGTVTDHSHDAGVDWLDHTSSALLVDFDNDGDLDMATAIEDRSILIMENDSTGKFQLASKLPIADRHVQGLSAADYDNDGKLDLYLTMGFADERARPDETRPSFVYHDANDGGANVLFRNTLLDGKLTFTDVTRQVGLDVNNRRHSLAAAWEDYDNDGDQDLYVANDYGQNCLYRNDQGRFKEIAPAANVVDFGSGMSASWADYDRDGDMDLYVGNMFSSAGNRITPQTEFQPSAGKDTRQLFRRFAKGNSLFRNRWAQPKAYATDQTGNHRQPGSFTELADSAGLQRGRWAWSSIFTDLNNDGWEDVVVANGYMSRDKSQDL